MLFTPNKVDEKHLVEVTKIALEKGEVTVLAYEIENGTYMAVEGSHRIEAAKRNNLPVTILVAGEDHEFASDMDDITDKNGITTIGQAMEYLGTATMQYYDEYDFEEFNVRYI